MNGPGGREWATNERGDYILVTAVFVLLVLSLQGVLFFHWRVVLEPRLRREATLQAEVLARSQANAIAGALVSGGGETRVQAIVGTLDELLLLRDPNADAPFFKSIELQVDYDAVRVPEGTLDLRRGAVGAGGFRTEVAVYSPESNELLAVAWFQVNDVLFHRLARDVRRGFWSLSVGGLVGLVAVWALSIMVFRKMNRQRRERERAERELWKQEKRYERLVNGLSNYFVYRRDGAGRLRFVSDSVRAVLGFTPMEFIRRYEERLGAQAAQAGESSTHERSFDAEMLDEQGHVHPIEISEVPVRDDRGDPVGFDGIARDVTAQRQVQEELRHAKEEAESANRAKSQFLANMSHELRTPLNGVTGFTSLALRSGDATPKVRDYLSKVQSSANLLVELVEDILDLSRIEASRLEIQRIEFDLDDLLSELADVIGLRMAGRNVEMLFSTAPEVPRRLRGDPVRLKQVLLNLLGNALKFTERGEIVVKIECGEIRREHAEIRFSVRDTGPGIDPELLNAMFEPFTQADASMTRRFGGLGLGLAISRRLVAMMGGEIRAESRPGEGTTFSFTTVFDLLKGPTGPRRLADEFRNLPVLVADDNSNARVVLSEMLRSLLCQVTVVSSGPEAVSEAQQALANGMPFRLAVLDWRMPGMDGTETARELARLPAPRPLPSILVTAFDRDEAERQAREVGIGVVLHKPISPSTLHDAIMKVLRPSEIRTPAAESIRSPGFESGQSVLLVEDNAINREVARELLVEAGLIVTEAHNGREALEALETNRFDIVMMDVQMPEIDGIEAVRRIRLQERFRKLPVIAMTAHAMIGDRERFIESGMSDYLAKPIDEGKLAEVLARWLRPMSPSSMGKSDGKGGGIPEDLPGLKVGEGVQRLSGNAVLYCRLVSEFVDDNREVVNAVRRRLEAGERDGALMLLHTLKGSAATLGAYRVAEAAAAAEQSLRKGTGVAVPYEQLSATLGEMKSSASRLGQASTPRETPSDGIGPAGDGSERVHLLVKDMKEQLLRNNLAAVDRFSEIRIALGKYESGSMGALGVALDRLDFQAAIVHLETLASELGVGLDGTL